jgi:pilus assembly protein CpaE
LLTVALVIGDQKLSQEIRSSVRDMPVHVAFEAPMPRPRRELLQKLQAVGPQVILLELDAELEDAEAAVQDIKSILPDCRVLGVGNSADPQVILGAFRVGCTDYLYPPLGRSLVTALGKISAEVSTEGKPSAPGGLIFGFLSAKGGCGATTIACHVAAEMRRISADQDKEKMLLADLDMSAGTVGFIMNAERRYHIGEAFSNTNRLDASFWGALVSNRSGLDIVAAPQPGLKPPPAAGITETLRFLRSQYRFVLADLGRGVNPFIETALDEIDRVYLVTTPERPALHQARQIAEYFTEKRSPRLDVRLILNRVPHKQLEPVAAECRDIVGLPVCCGISNSYQELYDASVECKLVSRGSRLGKDFAQAARVISRVSGDEGRRSSFSITPSWLRAAASFLR